MENEKQMVPEPPARPITIIIRKDGTVTAWCADMKEITGRCPEGWDRECDKCWCG